MSYPMSSLAERAWYAYQCLPRRGKSAARARRRRKQHASNDNRDGGEDADAADHSARDQAPVRALGCGRAVDLWRRPVVLRISPLHPRHGNG